MIFYAHNVGIERRGRRGTVRYNDKIKYVGLAKKLGFFLHAIKNYTRLAGLFGMVAWASQNQKITGPIRNYRRLAFVGGHSATEHFRKGGSRHRKTHQPSFTPGSVPQT
jgi:hypothetical protein